MTSTIITHIRVPGQVDIDLNQSFTMQGLYDTIKVAYPSDPKLSVVSIAIPITGLECKEFGIFDPIGDLKDAAVRLYNYAMQAIFKPMWDFFNKILKVLERVISFVIDLKLPILDLSISDLFDPNLYDKIKAKVTEYYYKAKDKLLALLDKLKIPNPLFKDIKSPELEIEAWVKSILSSLWTTLLKTISKIIGYIKTGLDLWDRIVNRGTTFFGTLWQQVVDAILARILSLIAFPPSLQEIYDYIIAYAQRIYNKLVVSFEEIMAIIKDFTIFGIKPFDWTLPLNFKMNAPNIDFVRILNDMKAWLTNYVMSLLQQFVNAVKSLINAFLRLAGITIEFPVLHIPITLCAVEVPTTSTA